MQVAGCRSQDGVASCDRLTLSAPLSSVNLSQDLTSFRPWKLLMTEKLENSPADHADWAGERPCSLHPESCIRAVAR